MDLKTRAPFFYGAEKQTACLKRTKQSGSSLFPPAWLTLTSSRLVFQGFGYGRRTPLFYRSASPLSICLGSVLQWGLTNCRRWILLATAALCFFGTPALLVAFPNLSPLWRVLLILDLALLAPAILLALFFRWPASFFCIHYQGGCLRLPLRWYSPTELQDFQSALEQALSFQKTAAAEEQAALTLARAAALREYALMRQQGLLTEEEFRQAKAQALCPPRR